MSGRWRRVTEREDGASAIEMVILFPVTLLVVLVIIQFGVWYHAAAIARAAAQQGVKTASAYGATAGAGQAQAHVVLDDNGRSLIVGTTVTGFRDGAQARMTVTGTALTVVPILHLSIHEAATAPVEAFRPPPGP
jgi:Flp pilus assembly protein TadG